MWQNFKNSMLASVAVPKWMIVASVVLSGVVIAAETIAMFLRLYP